MKTKTSCALVATTIALVALSVLAPPTDAQTLLGTDGVGSVLEFDMMPGLGCPPPAPYFLPFPYVGFPGPCVPAGPMLAPTGPPPGTVIGDIATDRLTDITYVTDGAVIEEFAGYTPFAAPGFPINSYAVPPIPAPGAGFMGPITGMGMDGTGAVTGGIPTLWVTDGPFIAGLGVGAPPFTCAPPPIVVPAFAHGFGAAVFLTDVTWDPTSGTLWGCAAAGGVVNVLVGGGPGPLGPYPAGVICGPLAGPLQGIAFDLASPGAPLLLNNAPAPALYVTDGFTIQYMDATTGLPAAPTFYTAAPCLPAPPGGITGLAYAARGVPWGTPGALIAGAFGQSSAPGPTFTVAVTGGTPGANAWVIFGVNTPASPTMGFFCPGLPALGPGILLYADLFTPPGSVAFLGVMPASGTIVLPSPIGPVPPPGVEIYAQFLQDLSTVGLGPWAASNPLLITTTAP